MTKPDQNIAPRSLDQLQRWMQSVITHPAGIEAGVMSDSSRGVIDLGASPLDEVVLPSRHQVEEMCKRLLLATLV